MEIVLPFGLSAVRVFCEFLFNFPLTNSTGPFRIYEIVSPKIRGKNAFKI
jgi:hypothetical protein